MLGIWLFAISCDCDQECLKNASELHTAGYSMVEVVTVNLPPDGRKSFLPKDLRQLQPLLPLLPRFCIRSHVRVRARARTCARAHARMGYVAK